MLGARRWKCTLRRESGGQWRTAEKHTSPEKVHSRHSRRWWPVEAAHALRRLACTHCRVASGRTEARASARSSQGVRKVGGSSSTCSTPETCNTRSQCAPHHRRSEHAATCFRRCCADEHRLGEEGLLSFQRRGMHLQVKLQDKVGPPWPRQFSNRVSHSGACERQGSASAHGAWPGAGRGRNGGRGRLSGAE